MEDNNYICKQFRLEGKNSWTSVGTGYASVANFDEKYYQEFNNNIPAKKPYLIEISDECSFEHEEERIITFYSENENADYAMSFEKALTCKKYWTELTDVLNKNLMTKEANLYYKGINLPKEENLTEFVEIMTIDQDRKSLCALVLSEKYHLESLKVVFQNQEKKLETYAKNIQEYQIFFDETQKRIQILGLVLEKMIEEGTSEVIENLLSDDSFMFFLQVMECDNDSQKLNDFELIELNNKIPLAKFVEHTDILQKVKVSFRCMIIKDYILKTAEKDTFLAKISAYISASILAIIEHVAYDKKVLCNIFERLREGDINAVRTIHIICSACKDHPSLINYRNALWQAFSDFNVFETLETIITRQDEMTILSNNNSLQSSNTSYISSLLNKSRKAQQQFSKEEQTLKHTIEIQSIEIMNFNLNQEPIFLKQFVSSARQKTIKYPFLRFLLDKVFSFQKKPFNLELFEQYTGLIKSLVDISNCNVNMGASIGELGGLQMCGDEKMLECTSDIAEAFIDIAYSEYIIKTLDVNQKLVVYQILAVDLLAMTCNANLKKFSEIIISKNQQHYLIRLQMTNRNKDLFLSILQMTKILVKSKDECIWNNIKFLVKQIFVTLTKFKRKNLVYCSSQEIIDAILTSQIKPLIIYFNESCRELQNHPFLIDDLKCLKKAYGCISNNQPIEENLTSIKKKSVDITPSTVNKSATRFLTKELGFGFVDEISDIGFEFDKEKYINIAKSDGEDNLDPAQQAKKGQTLVQNLAKRFKIGMNEDSGQPESNPNNFNAQSNYKKVTKNDTKSYHVNNTNFINNNKPNLWLHDLSKKIKVQNYN